MKKGFSLIELLLGVAVIGVLATVVVQSFSESRIRSHDANLKTSVRAYRQSLELYNAKYKTYFVFDRTGVCVPTYVAARHDASEYGLTGVGTGCVGLNGGGEGRMTRKSLTNSYGTYSSLSIADILLKEGVLSEVATYPGIKTFTSNDVSGTGVPQDFILTICDGEGKEAQSEASANNFAIYAQPLKTIAVEQQKSNHLCGSNGTPYPWHISHS